MRLAPPDKLIKLWQHTFNSGANVILMRHAPKSGSNDSGLSEEGIRLSLKYGRLLATIWRLRENKGMRLLFSCTSKDRTPQTLKLLFPSSKSSHYSRLSCLDAPKVTSFVQEQVDRLHRTIGRWRGYYGNHTYYFLEKLGGQFGQENLHTVVAERMAKGISKLDGLGTVTIYCGHSPSIEVGLEKLLGISLSELGGFLNPLDSIHLRMKGFETEWIARINPIVDYVDLESETYFEK